MDRYENLYEIRLLDDLHNYFPAFLYDQSRFQSVSDIFQYMNRQIDAHCNLFRRGQAQYNRTRNTAQQVPRRIITEETIDLIPMFHSQGGIRAGPGAIPRTGIPPFTFGQSLLSEYLTSIFQPPTNNMESVPVVPTVDQVDNSTALRSATLLDEQENCSICQENYTEGQAIRNIVHCDHSFHKTCIDTWFERNVHCPVCRYDIRTQA